MDHAKCINIYINVELHTAGFIIYMVMYIQMTKETLTLHLYIWNGPT